MITIVNLYCLIVGVLTGGTAAFCFTVLWLNGARVEAQDDVTENASATEERRAIHEGLERIRRSNRR